MLAAMPLQASSERCFICLAKNNSQNGLALPHLGAGCAACKGTSTSKRRWKAVQQVNRKCAKDTGQSILREGTCADRAKLENAGIDPATSRMLSERSTI
ncbi:hypothetical protein SRHO_G00235510 [Serrasalmus rhombeus]